MGSQSQGVERKDAKTSSNRPHKTWHSTWRHVSTALIDQLFPAGCLACNAATQTASGLCSACWRDTYFLTGTLCDRCGAPLRQTPDESAEAICDDCVHHPPAWGRGRCATAYEGAGRRAAMNLKHGDRTDLAPALARWVTGAGVDILHPDALLVPVPLHRFRLMQRRYNQAAELTRAIGKRCGAKTLPDALLRSVNTPPLKGNRATRHETLKDAFDVNPRRAKDLKGAHVILIDDVLTTGATLSACAEVLFTAQVARVDVLALARAVRDT